MKRFSQALAESGRPAGIPLPILFAMSGVGLAIVAFLLLSTIQGLGAESPAPAIDEGTAVASSLTRSLVPASTPTTPSHRDTPTSTVTPSPTASDTPMPSPTASATRTLTPRPTSTATTSPISVLAPLRTLGENSGASGYQGLEISGLSAGGNVLRLHGTVRMPANRYPDQYWEIQWASLSVIDDIGISVIDKRIHWYTVDDTRHTEDAYDIVAQWQLPTDTQCRFWIRLLAVAGGRSEAWYGQFDVSELAVSCQ